MNKLRKATLGEQLTGLTPSLKGIISSLTNDKDLVELEGLFATHDRLDERKQEIERLIKDNLDKIEMLTKHQTLNTTTRTR